MIFNVVSNFNHWIGEGRMAYGCAETVEPLLQICVRSGDDVYNRVGLDDIPEHTDIDLGLIHAMTRIIETCLGCIINMRTQEIDEVIGQHAA